MRVIALASLDHMDGVRQAANGRGFRNVVVYRIRIMQTSLLIDAID